MILYLVLNITNTVGYATEKILGLSISDNCISLCTWMLGLYTSCHNINFFVRKDRLTKNPHTV